MNVALIPARGGSKRLPNKNIKLLNGKPLIAYSIYEAIKSGIFNEIIVSTDSEEILEVARKWGASAPILRPSRLATDSSSDIEWFTHAINNMVETPQDKIDFVAILRPTSPLRRSETIVTAYFQLIENSWADSLRAMEVATQHPGKMWIVSEEKRATPFLNQAEEKIPTYNRPLQTLHKLWVQNASLEIVRLKSAMQHGTISGESVLAFEMPGFEGFDINTSFDWKVLDYLISNNPELLAKIP